jgi:hypothetical protein
MTKPTEAFKDAWLQIRDLEAELRAYEAMLATFKAAYPDFSSVLDTLLVAAQQSPVLVERMRQKYDVPLEKWLQSGVEVLSVEEVSQLLHTPVQSDKVH